MRRGRWIKKEYQDNTIRSNRSTSFTKENGFHEHPSSSNVSSFFFSLVFLLLILLSNLDETLSFQSHPATNLHRDRRYRKRKGAGQKQTPENPRVADKTCLPSIARDFFLISTYESYNIIKWNLAIPTPCSFQRTYANDIYLWSQHRERENKIRIIIIIQVINKEKNHLRF